MNDLEQALEIDLEKTSQEIIEFIQNIVEESKTKGVVVGISGGVDSGLAAALCVKALGPERVFGILMPLSFTPSEDTEDAKQQAEQLGIEYKIVPIQEMTEKIFKDTQSDLSDPKYKLPAMNARARMRMVILYYYANLKNRLVAGTGDKSEDLIGFFTKYGDGGVDFLPISHLYKTQVRALARHLGVPESIAGKPASPQLYPGHQATDELPAAYEQMDPVMVGIFDKKMPPEEVSKITGVSMDVINKILHKYEISQHKRKYPPLVVPW